MLEPDFIVVLVVCCLHGPRAGNPHRALKTRPTQPQLQAAGTTPGKLVLLVSNNILAGTACSIKLPAQCTFRTSAGECDAKKQLSIESIAHPATFTLHTRSAHGPTGRSPFRLVGHVSSARPGGGVGVECAAEEESAVERRLLQVMKGKWSGTTFVNAGFLEDGGRADRPYCITDASTCPAAGNYQCFALELPTQIEVRLR